MEEPKLDFNIELWPYPLIPDIIVCKIIFNGDPIAKQRARVGLYGNFYTPTSTKNYQESIGLLMKNNMRNKQINFMDKFGLRCIFYRSNKHRIDCDNLIKSISDAATGVIWKDDCQVMEMFGRVFLNSEKPRAEVIIYKLEDLSPKPKCPTCFKQILRWFPKSNRKFCSKNCYKKFHRAVKQCLECGGNFENLKCLLKTRKFCSRKCSILNKIKNGIIRKKRYSWKCKLCNGMVTRKEYNYCWICRIKNPDITRRNCIFADYKGEKKILRQWSKDLNINYSTLYGRIKTKHWDINKAFETHVISR